MRDIDVDFMGVLSATVTQQELREGDRTFWHDNKCYRISRAIGNKDGSITIQAKEVPDGEDRGTLNEYPIHTRFSPKGTTVERTGKVAVRGGKRKFFTAEERPFKPLKGDTDTGKGERRRRYI